MTAPIDPQYEALIRASDDPVRLVGEARYCSERVVDPLSAERGVRAARAEQDARRELLALCLERLDSLGYTELGDLMAREHAARLELLAARTLVNLAVHEVRADTEPEDADTHDETEPPL